MSANETHKHLDRLTLVSAALTGLTPAFVELASKTKNSKQFEESLTLAAKTAISLADKTLELFYPPQTHELPTPRIIQASDTPNPEGRTPSPVQDSGELRADQH